MSSDESDHGAGKGEPIYLVKVIPWRSNGITTLLQTLDAMHLRERYGGERNASSGAWPHFRTPGAQLSKTSPVKQLPRSFYNPLWTSKIEGTYQFKELHVLPYMDLAIPETIRQYVWKLISHYLGLTMLYYHSEAAKYNLSDRQVVWGAACTL